jgi:hypothetical protein
MPELGSLNTLEKIVEAGEEIYNRRRTELEREHMGHFAAVDVTAEEVYVAETSDRALEIGRNASPHGVFHLIRIGSSGAFNAGSMGHVEQAHGQWLL